MHSLSHDLEREVRNLLEPQRLAELNATKAASETVAAIAAVI